MNQVDISISPLVKHHFPEVFKTEGPLFVLFAEEYYKWMESSGVIVDGEDVSGSTIYHTRKLYEYKDIDQTIDDFIVYFKEKYLKGVEFDTLTSKRRLVKAALDLFRSKGSERSVDLLFKLVYGTKIEIYTPGDDVLRLSDGKWVVPEYLEVTRAPKTLSFVGQSVTGSISGASAIIEYIVTRNVKGNLIDVLYLSNLQGKFEKGDIINTTGSIEGCPAVTGSLTTIDITLAGQDFAVGEIVNIVSARGIDGKARITSVETQTGIVQFELIDGGWGFSTTANTTISSKVLTINAPYSLSDATYGAANVIYTVPYTNYVVVDNIIYDVLKLCRVACSEIFRYVVGFPPYDATLRSFLSTTANGTVYPLMDTDQSGSITTKDSFNFLNFTTYRASSSVQAWIRDYVIPAAIANNYIKTTYLSYGQPQIRLFTTVTQPLFNLEVDNITGSVSAHDSLVSDNGDIATVISSDQSTYANSSLLIVAPIQGNIASSSTISVQDKSVITLDNTILYAVGDEMVQSNSTSVVATGVVSSFRPVTILNISGNTSSNNGLHVGTYVVQVDSGATGYISATPVESNYGFTNVSIIAISNTSGTFNNTGSISVYSDNSNTTVISTATASGVTNGNIYYLYNSTGGWTTGAKVYKSGFATSNTTIMIASDVGGTITTQNNISATGSIIGTNATAIGITDITNTFYANGNTFIQIEGTGLTPNTTSVSTGAGADFNIGVISDSETVLLIPDRPYSNNDGVGMSSVRYTDMLITGANSTYGYMSDVLIYEGGVGYSNSDTVSFNGGNTGIGSYEAGNASIVTDGSGTILSVTLSSNTGNGYSTNPNTTINTSTGSGANVAPVFPLGFIKNPSGDITFPLLDLLTIEQKTIGTISAITGINPGENYNIDPLVLINESSVSAYNKRDYIIEVSNTTGSFINNELITQSLIVNTTIITSNAFSGNTEGAYSFSEYVYTTDGINIIGDGIVRNSSNTIGVITTSIQDASGEFANTVNATILTAANTTGFVVGSNVVQGSANGILVSSNSSTLVVKSVNGTFNANSTNATGSGSGSTLITATSNTEIYKLYGLTSKGESTITGIVESTYDIEYAKARVRSYNANTSTIYANRVSLFADFIDGGILTGRTSGANASIITVTEDYSRNPVGINASMSANVITSSGSIQSIQVIDSGLGYVQDETVTIVSESGTHSASGKANIINNGVGEGRYTSYDGFLDSYRYIHDGEYYQEYSYEVRSSIPFDKYADLLKELVHIAGTRMFGRLNTSKVTNNQVTVSSSTIDII